MIETVVLPALILLGVGFIFLDGFGSDDENSEDFAPTGNLPDEESLTFVRFDDSNDEFALGDGHQVAFAEGGDDTITGGGGNDEIYLSDGNDSTFIDADGDGIPDDPLEDFAGDDIIYGGAGSDTIVDQLGRNILFGGPADDLLNAVDIGGDPSLAPDTLVGDEGADTLIADEGDVVLGGQDLDAFVIVLHATPNSPVFIEDYEANEPLTIQLPLSDAEAEAKAAINESGNATEITVDGYLVAILEGFSDLDAVNLSFEAVLT